MLESGALTFREFMMGDPLPLATIHEAVLEFLRDRDDAVLFGAQAVNAYVDEPRMTQDIDILAVRAPLLVAELREHLATRFNIALRTRTIGDARGFRLFQIRKTGNRHLVDVRPVEALPSSRRIAGVLVISPAELVAGKVISYHQRRGKPKSGTDWRDLALLLLAFPDLKSQQGSVAEILHAAKVEAEIMEVWRQLVEQNISPADEDDEF